MQNSTLTQIISLFNLPSKIARRNLDILINEALL
jgi:hypothetical protein